MSRLGVSRRASARVRGWRASRSTRERVDTDARESARATAVRVAVTTTSSYSLARLAWIVQRADRPRAMPWLRMDLVTVSPQSNSKIQGLREGYEWQAPIRNRQITTDK